MARNICVGLLLLNVLSHAQLCFAQDNVSGELTLAQALANSLRSNPALAAFAWDMRMAEARVLQARLRPNPDLGVELEDLRVTRGPGSVATTRSLGLSTAGPIASGDRSRSVGADAGLGESQLTVRLSQLVELGGKRA